jgi:diguanylate cyclase (GGDEF)-like protein/PAS domain S-box-containing protein
MSSSDEARPDETQGFAALRTALDVVSHGLVIVDRDHVVTFVNERFCEQYGLSTEIVKPGVPMRRVVEHSVAVGNFPGSTVEDIWQRRQARLESLQPAIFHQDLPSGRRLAIHFAPLPSGGWVKVYQDVTEQSRVEAELREQNRRFDAAIENISLGIAMFDAEQRLIVRNARYCEIFHVDPDVVKPGITLREILAHARAQGRHPNETLDELYDRRRAILERRERGALVQKLSDGREISIVMTPLEGGGWVATYEDVTRARAMEAEVREQNRRFDAAIENMPHGLCMFDAEQRIIVHNQRYVEMLGLDPEVVKPGVTMLDIFRHAIAIGNHPGLTVEDLMRHRAEILAKGEPAYFIQPLVGERFIAISLRPMSGGGWVATYEDVTERRRAEHRIAHMARHDALTGLGNRLVLTEQLSEVLAMGREAALVYIDLDRFKAVNDTLGHSTGDQLLRAVCERMRGALSERDCFVRFGGDEFAVVQVAGGQPEAAERLARKLAGLAAEPFFVEGREIHIGASIGIALAPSQGADPETLMRNADLALYRAKEQGRGTWRVFAPEMDDVTRARRALELDLRTALAEGQFELHFQPQLDLASGGIDAFEALLRWRHPSRGLVAPGEFIALAEEIGLIVPIGEWALRQACRAAARWPHRQRVAVNVSPYQFRGRRLPAQVVRALADAALPASRLEIEITESVLLQDDENTVAVLRELRELGVQIALDDFGTGFSSLSHLRLFPIDRIKVDRSFVRDLSERPDSLAIVRAIVQLGRDLGLATTAEGVETDNQLALVRELGCGAAQGYLISRPMPEAELAGYLAAAAPLRAKRIPRFVARR